MVTQESTHEKIQRLEQVFLRLIELNRLFSERADQLEERVDQVEKTAKQKIKAN